MQFPQETLPDWALRSTDSTGYAPSADFTQSKRNVPPCDPNISSGTCLVKIERRLPIQDSISGVRNLPVRTEGLFKVNKKSREEQNNNKPELCIKSILLNLIQLQFVLLIYSMRFYCFEYLLQK